MDTAGTSRRHGTLYIGVTGNLRSRNSHRRQQPVTAIIADKFSAALPADRRATRRGRGIWRSAAAAISIISRMTGPFVIDRAIVLPSQPTAKPSAQFAANRPSLCIKTVHALRKRDL